MKEAFKPGVRVKAKNVDPEKAPWAERAYIKRYDREGFYVVERPGKSDLISHEDDIELAEDDIDLTGIVDIQLFKLLREAVAEGEAYSGEEFTGAQVMTKVIHKDGELRIERIIKIQKPINNIWLKVIV